MLQAFRACCIVRPCTKNVLLVERLLQARYAYFSSSSHTCNAHNDDSQHNNGNKMVESEQKKPDTVSEEDWIGSSAQDLLQGALQNEAMNIQFPSDVEDNSERVEMEIQWQDNTARRPKKDPASTSILIFPGQGSQFVGMGNNLLKYPNTTRMYKLASDILGYDLLKLCLNGPKAELDKTIYSQPAVLVTSLAAIEKLKYQKPQAVERCFATAGFSVGELSALTFAGAMTFEEAVKVVKVRAQAMQAAAEQVSSGMMVVYVGADHKLGEAMKIAQRYMRERIGIEEPVCGIANFLFTGCKVLAGHSEGLYFIEKVHKEFGIKRVKHLPVSGAFHSSLMQPAVPEIRRVLETIHLEKPAVWCYSNVTGERFGRPAHIKKLLTKQVTNQLKWEQVICRMVDRPPDVPYPRTIECGPGKQLRTMLRMTNGKAYVNSENVDV